jgi:hypothetical protein
LQLDDKPSQTITVIGGAGTFVNQLQQALVSAGLSSTFTVQTLTGMLFYFLFFKLWIHSLSLNSLAPLIDFFCRHERLSTDISEYCKYLAHTSHSGKRYLDANRFDLAKRDWFRIRRGFWRNSLDWCGGSITSQWRIGDRFRFYWRGTCWGAWVHLFIFYHHFSVGGVKKRVVRVIGHKPKIIFLQPFRRKLNC